MSDKFKMLDDDVGWQTSTTMRSRKRIRNRYKVVRDALVGLKERVNGVLHLNKNQIDCVFKNKQMVNGED